MAPNSLRCKIKYFCYNELLSRKQCDRILKALDMEWIPVKKRLPEDEQECLITYKEVGEFHVDIATYSTNLCKVDKYGFHTKKDISGFYGFDGEYGYYEWSDVVAWMPLPERYKEGEEEE